LGDLGQGSNPWVLLIKLILSMFGTMILFTYNRRSTTLMKKRTQINTKVV